jgi:hypothetical protein
MTPNQAEATIGSSQPLTTPGKPSTATTVSQSGAKVAEQTTAAPSTNPSTLQATLEINSSPAEDDISIDGNFADNTPSEVTVAAGAHTITISKGGFKTSE